METRAPYAVIGLFVLAAIAAVFGFVYWLNHAGGIGERALYRVRFEETVAGMLTGAAVLFNGIRVGEVTRLALSGDDPREIVATIAIAPDTPVRTDTTASIEFQGLTGVAVVTLGGGTREAPPLKSSDGRPPLIKADTLAGQSMTQAARTVLRRLDTLLADNAEPLHGALDNLSKFSEALARNSDRIDGILGGLERMTGGGARGTPAASHTLTAPREFPAASRKRAQVVVPEPSALLVVDTQKILILPREADTNALARAQWADNIPKLIQAKVIEAFENSNYVDAVSKPIDGLAIDYQLLLDVRSFQIDGAGEPAAKVEVGAKVLNTSGKIIGTRTFARTEVAQAGDPRGAVAAMDKAFGAVVTELVVWTAGLF